MAIVPLEQHNETVIIKARKHTARLARMTPSHHPSPKVFLGTGNQAITLELQK